MRICACEVRQVASQVASQVLGLFRDDGLR
jgi:hypothetical protein